MRTRAGWLVLIACVAFTASMAMRARGISEADEVLHWLYARHAPTNPWNFLHVWARPLCTLLLAPFAPGGFLVAKALSVLAGGVAAFGAWRAGRALGFRQAACAIPFTFVQPYFFQQTYGVWTEIVFAAFMGLWVWFAAAHRLRSLAIVSALLPLVRPEGFFVAALTGACVLTGLLRDEQGRARRLEVFLILPLGALLWAGLGWICSGDPLWLKHHWPPDWAAGHAYGLGNWTWLADVLPQVVPTALLILAVIGLMGGSVRRTWPILLLTIVILGVHATLWATGSFGSAGYARYFVTIAPAFAVLMTAGVERLLELLPIQFRDRVPASAVLALVLVVAAFFLVRNDQAMRLPDDPPDARVFRAMGERLEAREPGLLVWSAHPFAYLALTRVPASRFDDFGDFRPEVVRAIPPGDVLLVEDRLYLRREGNVPEEALPSFGFRKMPDLDLHVDQTVHDARHDPALENFHWALWRKEP